MITGSRSDDWIYWPFFVQLPLVTSNTARTYKAIQRYPWFRHFPVQPPLHTLSDSQFPLVVVIALNNSYASTVSSLSVSWQRIYNSLTVTKSCNHTLNLHRAASNSSSTSTELLWAVVCPFSSLNSDLILATGCRCMDSAWTQRKTQPVLLMKLVYRSVI
jgi:hypothetical protein